MMVRTDVTRVDQFLKGYGSEQHFANWICYVHVNTCLFVQRLSSD